MLKHRPIDRFHTRIPPDAFSNWTHQTAQQGAGQGLLALCYAGKRRYFFGASGQGLQALHYAILAINNNKL